jgi:hypothetical protein
VAADQLERPVGQPFLDEGVGLEVLQGQVNGLLQKHSREETQRAVRAFCEQKKKTNLYIRSRNN